MVDGLLTGQPSPHIIRILPAATRAVRLTALHIQQQAQVVMRERVRGKVLTIERLRNLTQVNQRNLT